MVLSNLPEEIQVDIFIKLPVKSILACRCVCRVWHSLIGKHNFVKTHLDHAIRNPKLMLQSVGFKKFTGSMFRSIDYVIEDMSSTSPTECASDGAIPVGYLIRDMLNDSLDIRILGSCNGLICMALNLYKDICIWNPSTGEYKKMQTPFCDPLISPLSLMQDEFGFCYDCIGDDYKLVRISYKGSSDQVNVYSLGSKSWKRIQNPNHFMIFTSKINTVHFLNGALHWIGFNNISTMCSRVVISFDASTQRFVDILFPKEAQLSYIRDCLGVLEDRLSLGIYHNQCIDVWLMQDYGVTESWSKRFSFSTTNIVMSHLKFLWSFKNGELLIKNGSDNLLYDPKNEKFKVLKIQGMDDIDMQRSVLLNYVESLVSPNSID
ncbi:F-box/kelch-repeat protein At3g06240-like [Papaver somniferum]|uniref:F-box/kelch-repeat protein At3g06240-like n=1 Tax=Papaver somniferum TaxID=3469 RepID=UPI000E701703|nr:F-box/kelch-repeat protein At3g06240-like [Papaver somniferum]